ncbi:MAG TPA: GNAT family N-acetyltransferase [Tepidisphaeraceae bacterium]|jgi:GNAT superfamily N-acetyltransferase
MITQNRPHFLPGRLELTPGTRGDYAALERFHYVGLRPATWAAVVAARWLPDDGPPRTVGVAVLSYPSALNRTRHRVFGLRPMKFGQRLRWVNVNLRTISRVIVHPQFRSLGLSSALIRRLCAACPTPYIEAAARMGRAHPMFEHSGFTRADPLTSDEAIYFWRTITLQDHATPSGPLSCVPTGEG